MRWISALVLACACKSAPPPALPEVDVSVGWPGASPEDVETGITNPIEEVIARLAHVAHVHSRSAEGSAIVAVRFEPGTEIDAAVADIQHAVASVGRQLPSGVDTPVVAKAGGLIVARYALVSMEASRRELYRIARTQLVEPIQRIDGVGRVEQCGTAEPIVEIALDHSRLASFGVDVPMVVTALRTAPRGSMDQLGTVAVGSTTLGNLAQVREWRRDPTCEVYHRGRQALELVVHAQAGANPAAVRSAVAKVIADVGGRLPISIELASVPDVVPYEVDASTTAQQIIHLLPGRAELVELPASGPRLVFLDPSLQVPPELRRSDATLEIRGPDMDTLRREAITLASSLHPASTLGLDERPKRSFAIDRAKAADLSIPISAIDTTLAALDGITIERRPDVPLVVRITTVVDPRELTIKSDTSGLVPLSSIVRLEMHPHPEILHGDRERMVGLRVHGDDVPDLTSPPRDVSFRLVRD